MLQLYHGEGGYASSAWQPRIWLCQNRREACQSNVESGIRCISCIPWPTVQLNLS